jgi:hypothetical protein
MTRIFIQQRLRAFARNPPLPFLSVQSVKSVVAQLQVPFLAVAVPSLFFAALAPL